MGIPKKKSRTITVSERKFRYIIRCNGRDGHEDQKELMVTVQEDVESPGRVLQWKSPYGATVTPNDVESGIVKGMRDGWDPSARGAAFIIPDPFL